MTHVHTTALLAMATVALVAIPRVQVVSDESQTTLETVDITPIANLHALDIIDGVRIIADDDTVIDTLQGGAQQYAAAGYPIENTEIRYDEQGCARAAGYHAVENGHHLIVVCTLNEYSLLHELGHVWSALYLSDERRSDWLELRGIDSWHEGDWGDRGTEHVAQIMAYGLYDDVHVPMSITNNDYQAVTEAYTWLTGLEPRHRLRAG